MILLGAWTLVAFTATVALLWGIPTLVRLRFVTRAEEIRDECMDLVLADQLPVCPPVTHFLQVQDLFINQSRSITLGRMTVAMFGLERIGEIKPNPKPSFADLTPAQRKLMNGLQKSSIENLQWFLRRSGPVGWIVSVAHYIKKLRGSRQPDRVKPAVLATQVNNRAWAIARGDAVRPRRHRAFDRYRPASRGGRTLIPH